MMTLIFSLLYVVLGLILVLLAKLAQNILTPYRIDEELVTKDNPALAVSFSGYMLAVILIFIAAGIGEIETLPNDINSILCIIGIDAAYALAGIIALNISRLALDTIMLPRFSTRKEIIEDRNIGMGAVEFGSFVATALTIGGAITGDLGGPLEALAFFALGQVSLMLMMRCYQLCTPYCIHDELEKDNVAAGISLAGVLIGFGIILAAAAARIGTEYHDADGFDWAGALYAYAAWVGGGLVMLMCIRVFIDKVMLPQRAIAAEIVEDQNAGVAWLEAVITIGMALLIIAML